MKKLALCMITKGDEELESLKLAVDSAKDFVDEVCITTNSDQITKTKKYCKEHGYDHSHLPWNDNFSEQRNFNFEQTSQDVDYILWLDSDDQLVGGQHLQRVVNLARQKNYDTIFFSYWYGCKFTGTNRSLETLSDVELYHSRERLLKKSTYRWKGAVHETPVEHEGIDPNYTGIHHLPDDPHSLFQIAVLHRDATRENQARNLERNERNKKILTKALAKERAEGGADPRTILYLMKILRESDERSELVHCISLGEEYLEKSGWDEERANCYIIVSECFNKLGEYERSKNTLMGALDEWPHNKGIFLALANAYFQLNKFRSMKLYMDLAEQIEIDKTTSGNRNLLDLKFKTHLLRLNYYLHSDKKNISKALEAAEVIYEIQPFEQNLHTVEYLDDLNEYNEAAKHIDLFTRYLAKAKLYTDVEKIIDNFPEEFKKLPFYSRLVRKYSKPRVWGEREICYYASFGGDHFEKWDPTSLKDGIGGSETAVIKLAKLWVKAGYKVTVYGHPKEEGEFEGVNYLSYKKFNHKDRFNILIQWRDGFLAPKVSAKKFYVDLHDVYSQSRYLDKVDNIDKFMVKSQYQRELAPDIPDNKFIIISNGV